MTIDIVDDNASDAERLKGLIERYAKESGAQMAIRTFKNGMSFLEHYTADTDVVFLDVEMPIMNGIDVAKKLRETDTGVCIVFVTNHAQFALKGYLVNALDYVIKPISYYGVVDRLKRAAIMLRKRTDKYILINLSVNEAVRVSVTTFPSSKKYPTISSITRRKGTTGRAVRSKTWKSCWRESVFPAVSAVASSIWGTWKRSRRRPYSSAARNCPLRVSARRSL